MNHSTLSRRRFLKGLLAGGGAALLAACGGATQPGGNAAPTAAPAGAAPTSAPAAAGATTLTWWDYFGDDTTSGSMQAQLDRYMAANPNVKIERTAIAFGDLKQKILQGAAANQLPDVLVIDNPDHQAFAALGVLEDLTDRIKEWGQADQYFDGPWASTVYQGKNYGIPNNSNCIVLWCNDELLSAAGVTPPTTWDELQTAAAALTKDDVFGLAVSGVKTEEGTFQWLPWLWGAGSDIPTINDAGGQQALQLWVDLVNNGYMSKEILAWTQQDARIQFQQRKAAMMINGPWQIPAMKEESADLKWTVAVIPQGKQGASILGGENYSIVKGKNVDAAWDVLRWTQEPENLKTFIIEGGRLSSRKDFAQDPYFQNDPVLKVFNDQLAVAKPRAYGSKYPEISNAIQIAIQAAVSGQSDTKAALDEAMATITPLLPAA
jgi:multiple sugar transport system substrate-binding protein